MLAVADGRARNRGDRELSPPAKRPNATLPMQLFQAGTTVDDKNPA